MPPQLELFEIAEPSREPDWKSIFLAIFPDSATAKQIFEQAGRFCRAQGLKKRLRPLSHLHVSLHHLGDEGDLRLDWVSRVEQICGDVAVQVPSFDVTFNHVKSFAKAKTGPIVLVGKSEANAPLKTLHRLLGEALVIGGFRLKRHPNFTPHVTLLYDRCIEDAPMEPVSWRVREMALIRSHVGMTKYDRLGSWKLAD